METLALSNIEAESLIYVRPGHVEIFKGRRISKSPQDIICIKKIFENSLDEANRKNTECMSRPELVHNNLVNILGVSREDEGKNIGCLVIYMDYFGEGDLERLIKLRAAQRKVWTQEELVTYFDHLISGFVHLQKHGVAHRNVNPSSIFVTDNSRTLKIANLGCSTKATGNNFIMAGTSLYLSPLVREAYNKFNCIDSTIVRISSSSKCCLMRLNVEL